LTLSSTSSVVATAVVFGEVSVEAFSRRVVVVVFVVDPPSWLVASVSPAVEQETANNAHTTKLWGSLT